MSDTGVGIFNIIITVMCIWLAWWALQGFRFDVFMRRPSGPQAKVLAILIAIVIGYTVASFIIEYLEWSLLLKQLL